MPISTIIFAIVVCVFAFRGFRQGWLRAVVGIVGFVFSYWAAFHWAPEGAVWLEANTSLQGFLAMAASGLSIFFLATIAVQVVLIALTILINLFLESEGAKVSLVSRIGGAMSGALVGVFFGLSAVYAYGVAMPMLVSDSGAGSTMVETEVSSVSKWANRAAGFVIEQAMAASDVEPGLAKMSVAAAEQPLATAQSIQGLSKNEQLQQLFEDPAQREVLVSGDLSQVVDLPAFQKLAASPELQQLADIAGISGSANSQEYQQQVAEKMSRVAQKMDTMRNDPRLQEMLNNPELQRQLNSSNPLELLNNPEMKEIADMLLRDTQ